MGESMHYCTLQTTELVLVASRCGRSARLTALFNPVESAVHNQLILKSIIQRRRRGRAMPY